MGEPQRNLRCAIYTRKSTEEGLDQNFNSLQAQREAAEAFIASQREAGWVALGERYDDGGFTGAHLERPALERLLADIEAKRVDCVVVYKVDRLSRSLLDFARLMSVFDRHQVSFVSVTQEFNTTTSMGRLTLNILLSFAQFEREIIAERTRDKLSAARKKGKWIGGIPVLGYDVAPEGGRLVVNEPEAERVRQIFSIAAEAQTLAATLQQVNARELTTKDWTSRNGRHHRAQPFSKSTLRRLLANVLYIGRIRHKGVEYPGEQPAIVEREVWRRVTEQPDLNACHEKGRTHQPQHAVLRGLLYCGACGSLMKVTRTRAYRYYVCDCTQSPVAAVDLEPALGGALEPLLGHSPTELDIRQLVQRVTYNASTRQVVVDLKDGTRFEFRLPLALRRGVRRTRRELSGRVPRVSRLMALALKFERMVHERQLRDYAEIARLGQVSRARLSQILGLLNLAPAIQETLLLLPKTVTGHDPITERHLRPIALVVDWQQQEKMFQAQMAAVRV